MIYKNIKTGDLYEHVGDMGNFMIMQNIRTGLKLHVNHEFIRNYERIPTQ